MEHLSKQQIVLLTLLVSFVTSIATGIVTVSLMDQAPAGVTQTINRVVEKTIERVASNSGSSGSLSNSAVAINSEDRIVKTLEKVSKSVVRIKPSGADTDSVTGLGIMVSKDGVILTDKASIASLGNLMAVFSDGQEFPIQVVQSQIDGDIVFVVVSIPADKKTSLITPASSAQSVKLGQTVLSLSGKNLDNLSQGIIEKMEGNNIETSIDSLDAMIGSPLFTIFGDIVGFETTSLKKSADEDKSKAGSFFHTINSLKPMIPAFSN
ncbi:MAG TPA: serine protease [Candidatus Paceibacterota bacterium]